VTESKKYTTETLAEFTHGLSVEDIALSTVEAVQRCFLDLIAAAVVGNQSASAAAVRGCVERLGRPGPAAIWFGGGQHHAPYAAFVNSAAASALDLDDGHRAAGGHPGAAVIPAVLAVAQEVDARWPDILAAVVAGYEVGVRVSAARDFSKLDTLSTGRWCAYGVSAAASRLRRLNIRQTAEAMAVAGVLSPGLSAAGYSRVMGNHAKEGIPWATLTGLWASELAAGGFTGPLDILDHPEYYDAKKLLAGLGKSFAVDGVYFKPYAGCRWIHCALDGLRALMQANTIRAPDIRAIEVHTFERALRLNNYPDPATVEAAQYSLPFCAATAAIEGQDGLLPLEGAILHRPDIVSLAGRVSLHEAPEFSRMFPERTAARVVIRTRDNRFETVCDHPLGDPANPMSWNSLANKFRRLSRAALSVQRREDILQAVEALPIQGVEPMMDLLVQPIDL
jgi:2-methylcitrate dehydratase PrpD